MDTIDIIAVAVCIDACGGLWWLAEHAERVKSPKWKMFWLCVPVLALLITKYGPDWSLLPLYIGSVIAMLGFFTSSKKSKQFLAAAGAVCMLLTYPVCLLNPYYRAKDYYGDFKKLFGCMRGHYVLTEHKNIDWDALYDKYEPQFRKIQHDQDVAANALTWGALCGEFHDGHVSYNCSIRDIKANNKAIADALGNDYGLSVMHCTDGSFAAVNVDESLAKYGIRNGTVITSWDGKSPDEVSKSSPIYGSSLVDYNYKEDKIVIRLEAFPDIDNEIFYSGLLCAGIGGDSVDVSCLDENGSEQTVTLTKLGNYIDRLSETMGILHKGVNIGNLQWKKLSDSVACLRIKGMSYDTKSYNSSDDEAYSEMKDEIRSTILKYQSEGVKDVIIDLRDNNGGSPHMVNGIVSMFAPKGDHYCCTNGVWDEKKQCWAVDENGNYVKGEEITFKGEDILNGGRVIVIVNANSVSAADMMTKEMESMDNARVIGFTGPNGSSQAIGVKRVSTGLLSFSNCVVLDKDGSIMIDSGADRQSSNGDGVEIIPFDNSAIRELFDEGDDYLLEKALEMLS